jgi:uncharacterized protein (DUF58 family)
MMHACFSPSSGGAATEPTFRRAPYPRRPARKPVVVVRSDYAGHMDDQAIRSLVTRLARAHPSVGDVIERAAILAEGADSRAVVTWIVDHGGTPEATAATPLRRGLHGALVHAGGGSEPRVPSRYVLPAGALD